MPNARTTASKAATPIAIVHVAPDTLRPAPYNPRSMTEDARAKLRRGIEQFGIVDPIVARRSDHLVVGGHQRLEAAKAIGLATVPVVYIDVDDNEAATLNVLLNNPGAQGEWDIGKLSDLLSELDAHGLDATLTGFDTSELSALLGHIPEVPFGGLPSGEKSPFEQMAFVLTAEQATLVREAMQRARAVGPFAGTGNENSNGNALARVAARAVEAYDADG